MSLSEAVFFARKTGGTGADLDQTQLGILPGVGLASFAKPEYRKTQVGGLIRWEIDAIVIPVEPTDSDIGMMRDQVNAYISDFLVAMDFRPLDIRTYQDGRTFVRARRQQRGDLVAFNPFSTSRTLEADVALSDVRIIDSEGMPHGGMIVRFIFVKEASNFLPSQQWCSFRIRVGGTGAESSRVNLIDSGDQSSRINEIVQQTDGAIERLTIRASYTSEFGTRTLQQVQAYAASQRVACQWHPTILRSTRSGKLKYLNTKNNFGDVTLDDAHNGSTSDTLLQNVTLEDVRVVRNESSGGVDIEYDFVRIRPELAPDLRYFRFRILSNGTGGHRKTVTIGIDDPESAWMWELDYFGRGKTTNARVRVWMPNDHGVTTLLNVQAKAEGIRNDCEFKPPLIKDMPRGKAIMPNLHNNFGSLVFHDSFISSSDATGTVILDNCTMVEPPRIVDNLNDGGCMMEFTFGRIADSNELTG